MLKRRRLLREEVTYSQAKEKEVNILLQLGYFEQRSQLFTRIDGHRDWIKAVIAHHLNLRPECCHISDKNEWIHGSFNVCVPITINDWENKQQSRERVILRLPLPYRVGDAFNPGNGDEKTRCEAGTYTWIQQHCPEIPIPRRFALNWFKNISFNVD